MRTRMVVLPATLNADDARKWLEGGRDKSDNRGQHLYPVVDGEARLTAVLTRRDLAKIAESGVSAKQPEQPSEAPVVAYPGEPLRMVAERMATERLFTLPVIDFASGKLLGLVRAEDLLEARVRAHERENKQERLRMPFGRRRDAEMEEAVRETA